MLPVPCKQGHQRHWYPLHNNRTVVTGVKSVDSSVERRVSLKARTQPAKVTEPAHVLPRGDPVPVPAPCRQRIQPRGVEQATTQARWRRYALHGEGCKGSRRATSVHAVHPNCASASASCGKPSGRGAGPTAPTAMTFHANGCENGTISCANATTSTKDSRPSGSPAVWPSGSLSVWLSASPAVSVSQPSSREACD